jgi:hypothetical protein
MSHSAESQRRSHLVRCRKQFCSLTMSLWLLLKYASQFSMCFAHFYFDLFDVLIAFMWSGVRHTKPERAVCAEAKSNVCLPQKYIRRLWRAIGFSRNLLQFVSSLRARIDFSGSRDRKKVFFWQSVIEIFRTS